MILVHSSIFGGTLAGLAWLWWAAEVREPGHVPLRDRVAAPARAVRWLAAGARARRAAHRDWKAGADLATAWTQAAPVRERPPWLDAPVVPDDWRCPYCGIWRCREGREGIDCGGRDERPVYAAGRGLPRDGRHTLAVRLAAFNRRLRLAQLRTTCETAPRLLAEVLGRPVRVGAAVAGPLGWLP